MKAIIQETYGGPESLKLATADLPTAKENEVLVRVYASSLNAPDWRLLSGKPFIIRLFTGLTKPKLRVKGCDLSGVIVGLGSGVTGHALGDEVMADLSDAGFGAFADFARVKTSLLAKKPRNLDHLSAAALPLTASTALQALKKGQIKAGDRVLIIGASGGVGSYCLQLAKYFGGHITAVTSKNHLEQAKELGASRVIDYQRQPLHEVGEEYDLVLALNGHYPLKTFKKLLATQGRLVMVGGSSMKQLVFFSLFGPFLSTKNGQQMGGLSAKSNGEDLTFISQLVEEGHLRPVIAHQVSFEEIPQAIGELSKGHTGGKIVTVVHPDESKPLSDKT